MVIDTYVYDSQTACLSQTRWKPAKCLQQERCKPLTDSRARENEQDSDRVCLFVCALRRCDRHGPTAISRDLLKPSLTCHPQAKSHDDLEGIAALSSSRMVLHGACAWHFVATTTSSWTEDACTIALRRCEATSLLTSPLRGMTAP